MKPFSLNRGRGVANIHIGSPELRLYKKDNDHYIKKEMAQSLYVIIGLKTALFLLTFITFSAVAVMVVQHTHINPYKKRNRQPAKVVVIIKYKNEKNSPVTKIPEDKTAPKKNVKKEIVKKEKKEKKTIKPKLKKSKLTKKAKKPKVNKKIRTKEKPFNMKQNGTSEVAAIKPYQPGSKNKLLNSAGKNTTEFTPLGIDLSGPNNVIASNPSIGKIASSLPIGAHLQNQSEVTNDNQAEDYFTDEDIQRNENFDVLDSVVTKGEEAEKLYEPLSPLSVNIDPLMLIIKGTIDDPSGRINSLKNKIVQKVKNSSLTNGSYCYTSDQYRLKMNYNDGKIELLLGPYEVPFSVISDFERAIPERLEKCNSF